MNPQDAWNAAFHQLEMQMDHANFETWMRELFYMDYAAGTFYLGVRNSYACDMLEKRLVRNVERVLSDAWGQPARIVFKLEREKHDIFADEEMMEMPLFRMLAQREAQNAALGIPQQSQSLAERIAKTARKRKPERDALNPRFTFERWMESGENPTLVPSAMAIVDNPGELYNPFLVYGGVGLGKTHFLHAMAHAMKRQNRQVIYISAEAFTNDLVAAIRNKSTAIFRDKYRHLDALLIDDIQFVGQKESTQEEIFHTFNGLYNEGGQIIFAADRPPRQLDKMVDRLKSRFESGLNMEIAPPRLETRMAIVAMWAHDRRLVLPDAVIERAASQEFEHIRQLEAVFNKIAAKVQLNKRLPTTELVEEVLAEMNDPRDHLTLTEIIETIAEFHGLRAEDLISKRRKGAIVQARQVAMYLARELTDSSLPEIGGAFGGRSHSTIWYGSNKIEQNIKTDSLLREKIDKLRKKLKGGMG